MKAKPPVNGCQWERKPARKVEAEWVGDDLFGGSSQSQEKNGNNHPVVPKPQRSTKPDVICAPKEDDRIFGPPSLEALPAQAEAAPLPERKPLSAFMVDHTVTLGMSEQEIDALRTLYVIDGIIRRGALMLMGAESKSRKSWLGQDGGICVAAGIPWLADANGENGFKTRQATVHVIDLELDRGEMKYRFAKARGNRFPDDMATQEAVSKAFRSYCFDGLNVLDIMPLIEEIRATVKPGDLVIVDCLYRLVPDGNETAEVAAMLEALKRFASETQCAVILIDHFRKAGDDKARNRFAGSFVKQASAATLVAIETKDGESLTLNIDARSFYGTPRVHVRFDSESYAFVRVPEAEVEATRQAGKQVEAEGWLVSLFRHRELTSSVTAANGGEKWGISRQSATTRSGKLVELGWLVAMPTPKGSANRWILTHEGTGIVNAARHLAP